MKKIQIALLLLLVGTSAMAQSKKEQIATLQLTVETLTKEKDELQSQLTSMESNQQRLINEKNNILSRLNDTTNVCKSQRSTITSLNSNLQKLNNDMHKLNSETTQLKQQLSESERKLQESESKIKDAQKDAPVILGAKTNKNISLDNYMAMYEIQVYNCEGWSLTMDGRYRFYNFPESEYGVMVALDSKGIINQDEKHICSYSESGGFSSGANVFNFIYEGTMVTFMAGMAGYEDENFPSLVINDEKCRMKMLKRKEPQY